MLRRKSILKGGAKKKAAPAASATPPTADASVATADAKAPNAPTVNAAATKATAPTVAAKAPNATAANATATAPTVNAAAANATAPTATAKANANASATAKANANAPTANANATPTAKAPDATEPAPKPAPKPEPEPEAKAEPEAEPEAEPATLRSSRVGKVLSGKINTNKLAPVISIFGAEHFKLNSCFIKNIPDPLQNINPETFREAQGKHGTFVFNIGDSIQIKIQDEPITGKILEYNKEKNTVIVQYKGKTDTINLTSDDYEITTKARKTEDLDNLCSADIRYKDTQLEEISSYFGKNNAIIPQDMQSYVYKTRKEFDMLYFPSTMKKEEKKIMIKLFRFIFNKEPFNASTDDAIEEKLFASFTAFDKIPCNGKQDTESNSKDSNQSTLWKLFEECIRYRIYGGEDDTASMGLNKEIASLRGILPKVNQEFTKKQYLRAQLLRMLYILHEEGRTCIQFSGTGTTFSLSKYHSAILELIRNTVKAFLQERIPLTEEEKEKHMMELINKIKELKPKEGDDKALYEDMFSVVKNIFDSLDEIDKKVDAVTGITINTVDERLTQVLTSMKPQGQVPQTGGAMDVDTAEEEYERVFSTAMEHIEAKPRRTQLLEDVCEVLGGKTLETAIEHTVTRKGFSLPVVIARLEQIDVPDKHGKSFLRCVQTLLEIKEEQYKAFEVPHLPAGEKRFSHTLSKYPSLKHYISEDLIHAKKSTFDQDIRSVEKKLRRVYPYTDFLLEDIHTMRKSPDPCSLFYKGVLTQVPVKVRKGCQKIVDSIPKCKEMLEELLELLPKETTGKLMYKEVHLPKGFSLLAEAIRTNIPDIPPMLPITIHESPGEFAAVLGDSPFLLLGRGTTLHGIKRMEIDVSDEIDDLRKGEISIAQLMFLYLFIKCDKDIDV